MLVQVYVDEVKRISEEVGASPKAIGLAFSGGVHPRKGVVFLPGKVKGLEGYPIVTEIEDRLGIPVVKDFRTSEIFRPIIDDAPPTMGHGGFVTLNNYMILVFENAPEHPSIFYLKEVPCMVADSQNVNFILGNTSGEPLPFVSIYIKDDTSQGTMSGIDGIGQMAMLKSSTNKTFVTHYIRHEPLEIEIEGDKCYEIEATLKEEIDRLQLGNAKILKVKKEENQWFIKMHTWKKFRKIYQRD